MPLSPRQVRLYDPVNTELAQGYSNDEYVGLNLYPWAEVDVDGGQLIVFGNDMFAPAKSKRNPGDPYARRTTNYSSLKYSLLYDGIEEAIPDEHRQTAETLGIPWAEYAMNMVMNTVLLNLEVEIAALATTLGNYATTNRVTLSGTSQLSHASSAGTLGTLIRTGKEAVRSQIGRYPNVIEVSAKAWSKIQDHPDITDRLKHTSTDSLTTAMFANLYEFQKCVVGKAIKVGDDNITKSDVWGRDIVMSYVNPTALDSNRAGSSAGNPLSRLEPSAGYTYVRRGHPYADPVYRDERCKSDVYGATLHRAPQSVGINASNLLIASYLIKDAVA